MKKMLYCVFAVLLLSFSCKQTKQNTPSVQEKQNEQQNEKIDENIVHITKITIHGQTKEGSSIARDMTFDDVNVGEVDVAIETSEENAKVAFAGESASSALFYKWKLYTGKNELKIEVSKGDAKNTYVAILNCKARGVYVSYYLNGKYMEAIDDSFSTKVERGENPLFETRANHLNIHLKLLKQIKSISINGKEEVAGSRQEFSFSIKLKTEEQAIKIVLKPLDAELNKSALTLIAFRAKGGENKAKMQPKLEISDDAFLPKESFLDKLESGDEPLYKVFKSPAKLNIKISDYEKTFLCESIKINDESVELNKYIAEKEIDLENGKEKSIKIEFFPKDADLTLPLTWTFKLATGGEKPKLKDVQLFSINDAGTSSKNPLDEEFLSHLYDGSNPCYTFDGDEAKITVGSKKNIIKDITFKLDGAIKKTMPPLNKELRYIASHIFEFNDDEVHIVEIIFVPKDSEQYSNMTYKFRLKKSGMLPTLPKDKFYFFKINGLSNNKLPKDFVKHVTDGSMPCHKIKGREAIIEMEGLDRNTLNWSEKVIFKCANEDKVEVPFILKKLQLGSIFVAKHRFVLPDSQGEYDVQFEIVPKDATKYRPLVYSFKLKGDASTLPMPLLVGFDGKGREDGSSAIIKGEVVNVMVQTDFDIIKEVKIGREGIDEAICEVKEMEGKNGKFYQAKRDVSLLDGDDTPQMRIIVRISPKDESIYQASSYTYILQGTKIEKDNAQFAYSNGRSAIGANVKFKPGCISKHADDYGSLSAILTARTLSTKAKVYAILSDPDGKPLDGEVARPLTNNGDGSHLSDEITFFENKPTFVVLFVIAEDGNTQDKERGTWKGAFNPSYVRFDYEKREEFSKLNGEAYDEIVIDKSKVKDDKVYVAFIIWKESYGFSVDNSSLESHQGKFQKLNSTKVMQSYITEININSLMDGSKSELEVKMPIKKGSIECMTYKVKIKL